VHTIVETSGYSKQASKLFNESEQNSIISYLGSFPESGDIIQGTGGVRKYRWATQGKGKSGGARIIHFYCDETMPLFLLGVFSKSEKAALTKTECNELKKLTTELKKILREKL